MLQSTRVLTHHVVNNGFWETLELPRGTKEPLTKLVRGLVLQLRLCIGLVFGLFDSNEVPPFNVMQQLVHMA